MNRETICIVGGTGFVGQHLAHRLTRDDYNVRVLTRRRERHRALIVNPDISVVETDVHSPEQLRRHFSDCSTVINLVGILNESSGTDNSFHRTHVQLVDNICNAAAGCGVTRLLHMSAINADASEQRSRYLQTKGEGEERAHAAEKQGMHVTSFRPSVIFGRDDSFFNRFAALLAISPVAFPLACPDSRLTPVFVNDVTEAMCRALDPATAGERLELCGPDTFTLKELVEYTRNQLGLNCRIFGLGDGLSRLQARILGLVPGRPFTLDNYYSLQKESSCAHNALPQLGIRPTAIDTVVPGYLGGRSARSHYPAFRRHSRRNPAQ